jgi:uncharacterized membrane protein
MNEQETDLETQMRRRLEDHEQWDKDSRSLIIVLCAGVLAITAMVVYCLHIQVP